MRLPSQPNAKQIVEIIFGTAIIFLALAIPFGLPAVRAYSDWRFDKRFAGQVVFDIQRGTLVPDGRGVVRLPSKYAELGYNGEVYIARRPGLLLVFFTTFKIHGDWRGFLYCSRPLNRSDKIRVPLFGFDKASSIPLTRQVDAHWWQCINAGMG